MRHILCEVYEALHEMTLTAVFSDIRKLRADAKMYKQEARNVSVKLKKKCFSYFIYQVIVLVFDFTTV